MRLIVTEKNNSAQKIADILSNGEAKEEKSFKVPFYTWKDAEGNEQTTIGLKGHVLNPAFPETYKSWQETDPRDLIDAPLIKEPTDKNVVKAIKKVAGGADDIIIATDFDREGELIGFEALQEIVEANPKLANEGPELGVGIKRARYSALTKEEIEEAFTNLSELSMPLANAGAARQDIDLVWGATLTRAVSRATRRFGSNFLSVGRVQSPTLGLIVEREMERRAHVAEPFWEVVATFAHEDSSFEAHHATDKFWKEAEAKAAVEGTKSPGTVTEIKSRRQTRKPPTPLNTTAFTTDASSRLGITPARAMRIAENLYMDGFVSYPRTDNTVYPSSLPLQELVSSLVKIPDFEAASGILDKPLEPTKGKKETTDHPPIYPTQAVHPKAVEGAHDTAHRRVYELIARRFLATFSPPMVTESTRADIKAGSEDYFVRGSVLIDAGYAGIYTYARSPDEELPKLEEGQELALEGTELIDKETQPPSRISQGKLIELMEERGLGTKATRADIIQKLYYRGYVHGDPPAPSETGVKMYEGFKKFVPRMATPDMTAEMEAEMDRIAAGEMTKDEVLVASRDMLRSAYDEMGPDVDDDDENAPWRQFAKLVWGGMDEDRVLGPCIVCEEAGRKQEDGSPNMLRVIRARKSGKSFVGCTGWKGADAEPDDPDSCDQTFPMPQPRFYDVFKLEDTCSICGRTPRVTVGPRGRRGRPWKLCFNEECPSMQEMKRKKAEREAAKKAKAEADEAKEAAEAKIAAKDGEATEEAEKVTAKAAKNGAKTGTNGVAKKKPAKKRAAKKKAPAASEES